MRVYCVRAVNTAADSENKIHEDATAAKYGFRGGLVPGVTVFGYMTLPVMEQFGEEWLERGSMNVRFREPVYHGEEITVEATLLDSAEMGVSLAGGRASGVARMTDVVPRSWNEYSERPLPELTERPPAARNVLFPGAILGVLRARLDDEAGRMSAPLDPWIGSRALAHPAVLLSLANQILLRNVALGPWIHVASEITNLSSARAGEEVTVRGRVSEQYERKGHEFVALDVVMAVGERLIQHVRHTAIWRPRYTEETGASA